MKTSYKITALAAIILICGQTSTMQMHPSDEFTEPAQLDISNHSEHHVVIAKARNNPTDADPMALGILGSYADSENRPLASQTSIYVVSYNHIYQVRYGIPPRHDFSISFGDQPQKARKNHIYLIDKTNGEKRLVASLPEDITEAMIIINQDGTAQLVEKQ